MSKDISVVLSSNQRFGLLFVAVFFLVAIYYWLNESLLIAYFSLLLSALFLIVAIGKPSLLMPINYAWYQLGQLIGKFVQPFILGVIYYVVLAPVAIVLSINGRDLLNLKKNKVLKTYWVKRGNGSPAGDSFKNQF